MQHDHSDKPTAPSDPNGRARVEALARAMARIKGYPLDDVPKALDMLRAETGRKEGRQLSGKRPPKKG